MTTSLRVLKVGKHEEEQTRILVLGLQKLWIGDLEESEDLGARLEEVLLAGTPACRAVVAGRWEEGGVSVPLSLQEPCLSERPCLGLMLCS